MCGCVCTYGVFGCMHFEMLHFRVCIHSQMHIFTHTHTHVCVWSSVDSWRGWRVWGGETCSRCNCCCKCWSWLCKLAMHAAVSPTSICVYVCRFTHMHVCVRVSVCVCACVYRHTHKQMESSDTATCIAGLERVCVCISTHTHKCVYTHTLVCT
jgi:hypothetical protein